MHQEHRTPGQARFVLGLQGHPIDFEGHAADEHFGVAGEHKGDLVRPRYGLLATRLQRALPGTGVGRPPHGHRGDRLQPEVLPTGPEGALQEVDEHPRTGDAPVEEDLDVEPAAQGAAEAAGDLGADAEHQRPGQRSLIGMEQPAPGEEAIGIDRADHAGGLKKHRDDVA
jgi:hypothetical protein